MEFCRLLLGFLCGVEGGGQSLSCGGRDGGTNEEEDKRNEEKKRRMNRCNRVFSYAFSLDIVEN